MVAMFDIPPLMSFLLVDTIHLSTKFEEGWASLRPIDSIHLKQFLNTDLRMWLYTTVSRKDLTRDLTSI